MNKFTVHYPNGIKRHINKHELALLSDSLEPIGPHEYSATSLQHSIERTNGPTYLEGLFTFVFKDKRNIERMETPRGMVKRLGQMGWEA